MNGMWIKDHIVLREDLLAHGTKMHAGFYFLAGCYSGISDAIGAKQKE